MALDCKIKKVQYTCIQRRTQCLALIHAEQQLWLKGRRLSLYGQIKPLRLRICRYYDLMASIVYSLCTTSVIITQDIHAEAHIA